MRMRFYPFNDREVTCLNCDETYPLSRQSTAVHLTGKYYGTLYEGWGCSFIQAMANTAQQLAFLYALGAERSYAEKSAGILKLFAKNIQSLPVQGSGTQHVIWTYNMEGDCVIVLALAEAYELLRIVGRPVHRSGTPSDPGRPAPALGRCRFSRRGRTAARATTACSPI